MAAQRNRIVFELGVKRRRRDGSYSTRTLAVHPFVTAPEMRSHPDNSRSHRQQTTGSAQLTRGGRALRDFQYQGTFGVAIRGAGPFIGTGEQRRAMFEREIVRLPDATLQRDLDEVLQAPIASPGLKAALATIDMHTDLFFLNVYDFWQNRTFEGLVRTFHQVLDKRSATGAVWYQMRVEELGPIVHEGIVGSLLSGVLQGLAAAKEVSDVIAAYNAADIANTVAVGLAEVPLAFLSEGLDAVKGQVRGLAALTRGAGGPLPDLFNETQEVRNTISEIRQLSRPAPSGDVAGVPTWTGDTTARAYEEAGAMHDMEEALLQVRYLGGYFGLSDRDWWTMVSGEGKREARGGRTYRVSGLDEGHTIERALGVAWGAILDLNDLLPDEALVPGTELKIPGEEQALVPSPVPGLPTLDSHAGTAAWGRDLTVDLATSNGDVVLLEGAALLKQGVDIIVAEFGSQILDGIDRVPDGYRGDYLADRLRAVLESDPRFASVGEVTVSLDGAGVSYTATVIPINGAALTVGRS